MQQVPLSLKVPNIPEALAAGVDKYTATMAPRRDDTRLIYLDSDVQAARWQIKIPYERDDADAYGPGGISCGGKKPDGPPLDAKHHVGPLVTCDSLVRNEGPGFQYVLWENHAFHAEYETPYDPPAPTAPITGSVIVTKYAVGIKREGDKLDLKNSLAGVEGRTVLYDASLQSETLKGVGSHSMGELDKTLPANLAEWRLSVTAKEPSDSAADVYLLNCTGKNGCYAAATQEISPFAKTLVVENPQAGAWRIAVRSRDQVKHPVSYEIHEALLTPATEPIVTADSQHASGASWTIPLPKTQSDAQYAAFRIAGTPGNAREKKGLVIAMTPLSANTP